VAVNARSQDVVIDMLSMEQVPYGYVDENGNAKGVLFDILNKIIVESKLDLFNQLIPIRRLDLELTQNKSACSLVADVPNIINNLDLIEPIGYKIEVGVLPRKGVKLFDYKSLTGKVLAVPFGIEFDEKFDNDTNLQKLTPPKYLNAVRMLKAGRVDAAVGAISNLLYLAKREGMARDDFDTPLILSQHDIQLVCSKGLDKTTRQTLKQAVKYLKSKGQIEEILSTYFGAIK